MDNMTILDDITLDDFSHFKYAQITFNDIER